MDISKAYDCLPHDLLVAKLAAYAFDISSLCLKIAFTNSYLQKIFVGVPHGSVLGPLLFNILINDLFLYNMSSEICNFADDDTFYS